MTPAKARALLAATVTFGALGYGHGCRLCGAVVIDREQHELWHAAMAAAVRPGRRPRGAAT